MTAQKFLVTFRRLEGAARRTKPRQRAHTRTQAKARAPRGGMASARCREPTDRNNRRTCSFSFWERKKFEICVWLYMDGFPATGMYCARLRMRCRRLAASMTCFFTRSGKDAITCEPPETTRRGQRAGSEKRARRSNAITCEPPWRTRRGSASR